MHFRTRSGLPFRRYAVFRKTPCQTIWPWYLPPPSAESASLANAKVRPQTSTAQDLAFTSTHSLPPSVWPLTNLWNAFRQPTAALGTRWTHILGPLTPTEGMSGKEVSPSPITLCAVSKELTHRLYPPPYERYPFARIYYPFQFEHPNPDPTPNPMHPLCQNAPSSLFPVGWCRYW